MHRNKELRYSITSSARAKSRSGTFKPRALAVYKFEFGRLHNRHRQASRL